MSNRTPRVRGQSEGRTTRVALRIAEGPGPAYLAVALDQLLRVNGVEVVLALIVPADAPRRGRLTARAVLERTYEYLERAIFRAGPRAMALVPAFGLPVGLRQVRGSGVADQIAALADARADVLVDLIGDGADELPIPGSGRWRLRYTVREGGPRRARLARPALAQGLAEAVLAIDLGSGAGVEVCYAVGALPKIGFYRSRDALYWRSSAFAARKLARLVAGDRIGDWSDLPPPTEPQGTTSEPARSTRTPPFVELFSVTFGRILERLVFATSWVVLVRRRSTGDAPPVDLRDFRLVAAPRARFYADPFVVVEGPVTRLYVEDCPVGHHRGRISALTLAAGDEWSTSEVVLADLEHRAYPHVSRTSKGLLMTPDSGRAGGVDIFRSAEPGAGWLPASRCLEGVGASDPTLLEHDGKFWLFVAVTGHGMSPWDELHLYSASDPDGPWHAHPQNPVVADVRRARPAGRIFRVGGTLIRPGQDCSVTYGRRIVLNAIDTLTETAYSEHPISLIEPNGFPGIERTHTYSFDGTVEALDGYRRRFRFARAFARRES